MKEPANAQKIYSMIVVQGATIMLAGNAKKMPQDVEDSLAHILHSGSGSTTPPMSKDDSVAFIKRLEATGRFQRETWS